MPAYTSRKSVGAYRRLLDGNEEDPLSGVANLFDVGMVLIAALILALAVAWKTMPKPPADPAERPAADPVLERLAKKGFKLDKFRPTGREMGGDGQRLGTAYQLKNGEVVYVPDPAAQQPPTHGDR